jgi:hypothetical protein
MGQTRLLIASSVLALTALIFAIRSVPSRHSVAAPSSPPPEVAVAASRQIAVAVAPPPSPVAPSPLPSLVPHALAPPPPDVARTIERELPALRDEHDVDRYLDTLVMRARANRDVSARELIPGIRAISAHVPPDTAPERIAHFSQRLDAIARELAPPPLPAESPDAIADRLQHAADAAQRQALVQRYIEVTRALSPEERSAAMQQLARITQQEQP